MIENSLRIVLVETSHPGNIGAAARAMKTMSLNRLYLVNPYAFPDPGATSRAAGADDLLESAIVCDHLDAALSGCSLVIGASARRRSLDWPMVDPRQAATLLCNEPGETALVFGRERSGLSNDELDRCQRLMQIPSNPDYSSLNLAAAVQVATYEVMMQRHATTQPAAAPGDPLASSDELEGLFAHMEGTLQQIGFLDPNNPRHMMRRLRRLYARTRLEQTEVNILRGILSETQRMLGQPD